MVSTEILKEIHLRKSEVTADLKSNGDVEIIFISAAKTITLENVYT